MRRLQFIAIVIVAAATLSTLAACASRESNYWAALSVGVKELTENSPKR